MPTEPSKPTLKRLFAVSGNRCAFTGCSTVLADNSGTIIGEVCHIKGDKPNAKRYDPNQSDDERHGFDNLIICCGTHHTVIDGDAAKYSVEILMAMKQDHERKARGHSPSETLTDQFVEKVVVVSNGQIGGQTANKIVNNYGTTQGRRFCVMTHLGCSESVDESRCDRYGRPVVPSYLRTDPKRLSSDWITDRLLNGADLGLYLDRNWSGGTWFVADLASDEGEVINLQQLEDLRPASPTTTSSTTSTTTTTPGQQSGQS